MWRRGRIVVGDVESYMRSARYPQGDYWDEKCSSALSVQRMTMFKGRALESQGVAFSFQATNEP